MRNTEERLRELEQQVEELSGDLRVLRTLIEQDHGSALNKIRYVTEKVLHGLCTQHTISWGAREPTLENMIGPLMAAKVIPKNVAVHVRTIQTNASPGSHFQEEALTATHVQVAQISLLELLEWYYRDAPGGARRTTASQSLPRAQVKGRRSPLLIGAGVLLIAGGAAAIYLASRGGGDGGGEAEPTAGPAPADDGGAGQQTGPPPGTATPAAGLDALARYQHPRGEADELGSSDLWQAAADDFARAGAQPGSPSRWRAGERFARAQVAILRGELDGAADELRAAAGADPGWAAPHAAMAVVESRRGNLDAALAGARQAQRMEPGSWVWVAAGARSYRAASKLDDAIQEYRRALTMAPKEPVLLAELSLVFHAAGMDGEAERHARDALAGDPDLVGPRLLLAERAIEARDGKTAKAEAQRALASSPRSVAALLALADAQALLRESADAMVTYKKALDEYARVKSKGASEHRLEVVRKALAADKLPPPRTGQRSRSRAKGAPAPKGDGDRARGLDDDILNPF